MGLELKQGFVDLEYSKVKQNFIDQLCTYETNQSAKFEPLPPRNSYSFWSLSTLGVTLMLMKAISLIV
jgi:hypothetical protein